MNVVITGSSGFLGRALAERLTASGYDVVGLDIRGPGAPVSFRHETIDICDRDKLLLLLRSAEPAFVIHAAARIDIDPRARVIEYGANIEGVANLLFAVARTPSIRRVIWTSSQLVSRIGGAQLDDTRYDPDNTYGDSKVITERLVRALDGGGREWTLIRPTTIWGPGMSDHYRTLVRYIDRGRYFHVGSARNEKSFSYIHNATYQIETLMTAPAEKIWRRTFYIADYQPIDLRDWCNRIAGALGRRDPPTMPLPLAWAAAKVGDVLSRTIMPDFKFTSFRLKNINTPYLFDMRALSEVVGPIPIDLDTGIRQTVAWYRGESSNERAA
jgi:nucleoside-diphosphate-sugar epimerase